MPVQFYVRDAEGAWVSRTDAGTAPTPEPDPEPDPTPGNPGTGWWPDDLSPAMSLAALKNAANFGPEPGATYPNTMAASSINSSGITNFDGYKFTGSGSINLTASNKTFTNCLWDGCYPLVGLGASNLLFDHCATQKLILVSGASGIRFKMHRLTGIAGTDAIHITNDRAGQSKPVDITFDGIHAVGDKDSYISGGNHMDTIQVRGCDRLVLHNFCFDQGTVFDALFTATVFIENANGGSSKVLVNNGYSRSQGYRHMMMFGAEQYVKNMWFANTGHKLLHEGGTGQTLTVESGNKWENGDPIPTLFGVP